MLPKTAAKCGSTLFLHSLNVLPFPPENAAAEGGNSLRVVFVGIDQCGTMGDLAMNFDAINVTIC